MVENVFIIITCNIDTSGYIIQKAYLIQIKDDNSTYFMYGKQQKVNIRVILI